MCLMGSEGRVYPLEIASENSLHRLWRITMCQHDLNELDELFRLEAGAPVSDLVVPGGGDPADFGRGPILISRFGNSLEEVAVVPEIRNVIRAEADMIWSNERHHIVHVSKAVFAARLPVFREERSHADHTDNAAFGGARADLFVMDVADMRENFVGARVRKDRRPRRQLH